MPNYQKTSEYFMEEMLRKTAFFAINRNLERLNNIRIEVIDAINVLEERIKNPNIFGKEYEDSENKLHKTSMEVFRYDKLDLLNFKFEMSVMWALSTRSYYAGPPCHNCVIECINDSLLVN